MFLDTSALIAILQPEAHEQAADRIVDILNAGPCTTNSNCIGEVADWARRIEGDVEAYTRRIQAVVAIVAITPEIAVEGSRIKAEARKHKSSREFSLMDGIGLACARSRGMRMVTLDPDFKQFDDVLVLKG